LNGNQRDKSIKKVRVESIQSPANPVSRQKTPDDPFQGLGFLSSFWNPSNTQNVIFSLDKNLPHLIDFIGLKRRKI